MPEASFDTVQAHKYFSAHCFNGCWKLLDLVERSPEQNEELVALGHASLWHWLERPDRSDQNLSVAYWMLARIYATVGRPAQAVHYARQCADVTERAKLAPFYRGCAHEALARAFNAVGDAASRDTHLAAGRGIAASLTGDEQKILTGDLDTIGKG